MGINRQAQLDPGGQNGVMGRAEDLAAEVEGSYGAFADFAAELSPEEWRMRAAEQPESDADGEEGRPVAVVAHHLGEMVPMFTERALWLARGDALDPLSPEQQDAANRRHAAVNPAPDQAETLAMLRDNAERAAAQIRALSDDDLQRPGEGPMSAWTAEQLIRRVLIGHVAMHESSIREATGR